MASVFKISKDNIADPMKWLDENIPIAGSWEKDELLQEYHKGSIYFKIQDNFIQYEDLNQEAFCYWEKEAWLKLAQDKELIYGFYSEDTLEAEFIHMKNGVCIREFRYCEEVEIDEGGTPNFETWVDVASYVDKELL